MSRLFPPREPPTPCQTATLYVCKKIFFRHVPYISQSRPPRLRHDPGNENGRNNCWNRIARWGVIEDEYKVWTENRLDWSINCWIRRITGSVDPEPQDILGRARNENPSWEEEMAATIVGFILGGKVLDGKVLGQQLRVLGNNCVIRFQPENRRSWRRRVLFWDKVLGPQWFCEDLSGNNLNF